MTLDQNPRWTVTRFWCVGISMYACRFSVPQMRQFCLPRSKWASSEKKIFFVEIGIFCKSIAGPLSEAETHWIVKWLQLRNQLNFVWRHTKVFMQNSSQWCLRNVQLLRTTMNWCWWLFTHTFCHSSNIFGCIHCFTLWFIDEDASFFHFFHKITNIRSTLTVLLFFKNSYAIFANILQHYHDFQSNVAIFPSVIEAYTQGYSCDGRIKLIICRIKHELGLIIHEISTSWIKTLDGGPYRTLLRGSRRQKTIFFIFRYSSRWLGWLMNCGLTLWITDFESTSR